MGINPVNDAPEAQNDSYTTAEDTPLTVNAADGVLDNDIDVDGDNLTATLNTGPAHGTVVLNPNGSFTYTPDANYNGSDSFIYTVSDGANGAVDGTITVTITAVNDAPVAGPDTETIAEDSGPVAIDVLNNDGDDDGDTLGIVGFTQAGDGNVNCSGTNCTYTPDPNYNGSDSFTYRANDGTISSEVATVTINVSAVNDAPTATLNGPNAVNEGDTATYTYTVIDPEPDGFTPNNGFPDCGTGGELVGTPTETLTGGSFKCRFLDGPASPTVRVRVSDLQGEVSNIATRAVTVADVIPTLTMSGPSKAKWGQTKTYQFSIVDPGEDTFDFAASYPSCGTGAVLVDENMGADSGSFQCKFVQLAKPTLVVRVRDLDGGLSNMASWQVKVEKKK